MAISTELEIKLEPTYSLTSIGIADISTYNNPAYIVSPSLEIIPPIGSKVTIPFIPQSINIIRSLDIGLTCEGEEYIPLPDGVYCFKYSIEPHTKYYTQKCYFRIDNLICKFGKKFLEIDTGCCESGLNRTYKKKLQELRLMIEGIIADSNICDFEKANYFYNFVVKELDNMSEPCEC